MPAALRTVPDKGLRPLDPERYAQVSANKLRLFARGRGYPSPYELRSFVVGGLPP